MLAPLKRQIRNVLRAAIPLSLPTPAGPALNPRKRFDSHRKSWFIPEFPRNYAETAPSVSS